MLDLIRLAGVSGKHLRKLVGISLIFCVCLAGCRHDHGKANTIDSTVAKLRACAHNEHFVVVASGIERHGTRGMTFRQPSGGLVVVRVATSTVNAKANVRDAEEALR